MLESESKGTCMLGVSEGNCVNKACFAVNEEAVTGVYTDVSVGGVDPNGWTALHLAAHCGKSNPSVDLNSTAEFFTPGDLYAVKRLLDAGASIEAKGPNSWTALHLASKRGETSDFVEHTVLRMHLSQVD